MMDAQTCRNKLSNLKCCVIIPTYNNAKTIEKVISSVREYADNIMVVNDGSTDKTTELLQHIDNISLVSYVQNQGKGYALRKGFAKANELGFEYAITIDSDGQHFAEDIPSFVDKIESEPGSLIVGARNMSQDGIPGKSSFGHKFSNFWFHLETGVKLPDTQSGFRLYPLKSLSKKRYFTKKYEFEIEVIVRAAWSGIPVTAVPIKVFYATGTERVSHFRPFRDFGRISVLNTVLVFLAIVYFIPFSFLRSLTKAKIKEFIKDKLINSSDSNLKLTFSIAFGVFMGIVPIWGYQMLLAIFLAWLLKLNKVVVIAAANISLPPMIPFILYFSYLTGVYVTGSNISLNFSEISFHVLKQNLFCYIIGSIVFAIIMAIFFGLISYVLLRIFRQNKA
jgi:glycosyltransferase involved in cell wall biosynthesis